MIDINHFSQFDTGHFDKSGLPMSFTFINNIANNLVVTVGCSWTWGANMTANDDPEHRLKYNFGSVLANELSADWLNLGQVGSGNMWMAQKIEEFIRLVPTLTYKKIYIICTLTEIGRQCRTELDNHIDYNTYFKTNHYSTVFNFLNDHVAERIIQAVEPYSNIVLRIGTNFVDPIGLERAKDYVLPQTWLSLLCQENNVQYKDTCYVVGSTAITRLQKLVHTIYGHENRVAYIDWLSKLIDAGKERINLGIKCGFLPGTGHPGASGHKLWAQHILGTL